MTERRASCSCGALELVCDGEPVRISVCHCLACQRRTGSAFGAQARFARERVRGGEGTTYSYVADAGNTLAMHFCPACGSTVWWENPAIPGFVTVALGAFADPSFPPPSVSIYEERRHPWITIDGDVEHID